jgi:hypothetical protein
MTECARLELRPPFRVQFPHYSLAVLPLIGIFIRLRHRANSVIVAQDTSITLTFLMQKSSVGPALALTPLIVLVEWVGMHWHHFAVPRVAAEST